MRRAFALSWVLGTAIGVVLGLLGVQLVTSGIAGSRITPLSRPEVLQALAAGTARENSEATAAPASPASPAPTDIGLAPPLSDPVSQPAPTPPASAPPRPGATAGPTFTTAAPPTTTPPPSPPATSPPPAPPTTAAPPDTAPKEAEPPSPRAKPERSERGDRSTKAQAEHRTISSRGGRVAVRYQDGEVRLLWARPNDGYDVVVERDGPRWVHVRFRGDETESRVFAFYNRDGEPADHVAEGRDRDDRDDRDGRDDRDDRDDDATRPASWSDDWREEWREEIRRWWRS